MAPRKRGGVGAAVGSPVMADPESSKSGSPSSQERIIRRRNCFVLSLVAGVVILMTLVYPSTVFIAQSQTQCQTTSEPNVPLDVFKNIGPSQKFDDVTNELYQHAIHVGQGRGGGNDNKICRSRFSLWGWRRGTGGLDDDDRKALGELYFNAASVFEYGLGESTLIAAQTAVPRYAGIDSDALWVMQTRDEVTRKHPSLEDRFRFFFGDVGETLWFGYPENDNLQKNAYDYQIAPLILELAPFDAYMVDGRYRVACACVSFLHAIKYGADMDKVRVATHDNFEADRGYGVLKEVADVIIEKKKLWIYKLKPDTTQEDLFRLWEKSVNITSRRRRLKALQSNETNVEGEDGESFKFDSVAKILHDRATQIASTVRNNFGVSTLNTNQFQNRLSLKERTLLLKLYREADSVFEYGLGESTYIASQVGVPRFAGMDSDAHLVSDVRTMVNSDHFRFFFADVGQPKGEAPTNEQRNKIFRFFYADDGQTKGGAPANKQLNKIHFDYQVAPLLLEKKPFGIYLVNGQFRIACVCMSFLHAMKHGGNMDKIQVLLYDNSDSRLYHGIVSSIADVVVSDERLFVYKLKSTSTEEDVFRMWDEYYMKNNITIELPSLQKNPHLSDMDQI